MGKPQVVLALNALLLHFLLLSLTPRRAASSRLLPGQDEPPPMAPGPDGPVLSFFMHDILGGSAPSERVVAGLIANPQINNLPFSKRNGGVFPLRGGVSLVNANANGNNNAFVNGKSLPFVKAGQLPAGSTQDLVFGTVTVIDDEITEGRELGALVIGNAQGFHVASSLDGSSQTMAFTVMFASDIGGDHEDTISFFGVHRTATVEKSLIAIVGGTGKFEDAKGYTTIETVHLPDQHTTDGFETLFQFNIYLTQ